MRPKPSPDQHDKYIIGAFVGLLALAALIWGMIV
jgi:hypothetical protein